MIHITQGHAKGIGLEIFLKTFLLLDTNIQNQCLLHTNKKDLIDNLKLINIPFKITDSSLHIGSSKLNIYLHGSTNLSATLQALKSSMSIITTNDIMINLPSSKDQFRENNVEYSGHTEYFRHFYGNQNITMNFLAKNMSLLLLTDHIPLSRVVCDIRKSFIIDKVNTSLDGIKKFRTIKEVLFAGINPHAGENGIIGNEEEQINQAIFQLRSQHKNIDFAGPFAADTLLFKHKNEEQLFVFAYHDQGLGCFKSIYGLNGINLSLGLPFTRVSVDHGTAFEIFGQNRANYSGLYSLFLEIKKAFNKKAN